MSKVVYKTTIRTVTESCSLSMNLHHFLAIGKTSDESGGEFKKMLKPPPQEIHITCASPLVLTISGSLNRVYASPKTITDSHIARHLVEYLKLNRVALGLDEIEGPFLDLSGDNPQSMLSLRSSRTITLEQTATPIAKLIKLHVYFDWKTSDRDPTLDSSLLDDIICDSLSPFAPNLPLTFLNMLHNSVARSVKHHLVRRYPLIFGEWRKQFLVEVPHFTTLYDSIRNIVERSPNSLFQDKCDRFLDLCRSRISSSFAQAANALVAYGVPVEAEPIWSQDRDVFNLMMTRFYQHGLKKTVFKSLTHYHTHDDTDDDGVCKSFADHDDDVGPAFQSEENIFLDSDDESSKPTMMDYQYPREKSRSPLGLYASGHIAQFGTAISKSYPADDNMYDSDFEGEGTDDFEASFPNNDPREFIETPARSHELCMESEEESLSDNDFLLSEQCDHSSEWSIGRHQSNLQLMGMETQFNSPRVIQLATLPARREENGHACVESDTSYYSMLDHDSDNDIVIDHGTMNLCVMSPPKAFLPEGNIDKEWVGEEVDGIEEFVSFLVMDFKEKVDFD